MPRTRLCRQHGQSSGSQNQRWTRRGKPKFKSAVRFCQCCTVVLRHVAPSEAWGFGCTPWPFRTFCVQQTHYQASGAKCCHLHTSTSAEIRKIFVCAVCWQHFGESSWYTFQKYMLGCTSTNLRRHLVLHACRTFLNASNFDVLACCVNSNIKWFKRHKWFWRSVSLSMSERTVSCVLWFAIPKANSDTTLGHCCSFTTSAGRAAEGPASWATWFWAAGFPMESAELDSDWQGLATKWTGRNCGFQFRHTMPSEVVSELSNFIPVPLPESWSNRNESGKVHGEEALATSRSNSQRALASYFELPIHDKRPSRTVWLHKLCLAGAWIASTTSFRRRSLVRGCFGVEGRIIWDASLALKTRKTREQFVSNVWCEPWKQPNYSIPNQTFADTGKCLPGKVWLDQAFAADRPSPSGGLLRTQTILYCRQGLRQLSLCDDMFGN
jgi:hypothetical protein